MTEPIRPSAAGSFAVRNTALVALAWGVLIVAAGGCAAARPVAATSLLPPEVAPQRAERSREVAQEFDALRDEAQLAAARGYWKSGAVERCLAQLDALVRRSPSFMPALRLRAEARLALDDCAGAADDLEKIIAQAPADAAAWHLLGLVREAEGNFGEACRLYGRACELDSRNEQYASHYRECLALAGGPQD